MYCNRNFNQNFMSVLLLLGQLIFAAGTDDIQAEVTQFESALKSRNYDEALNKYKSIKTDQPLIKQAVINVYKELNDIDIILYFNSLINDLNERAQMFNVTYEGIIKDGGKDAYKENTDNSRIQGLYLCNKMKFIQKVENDVINVSDEKSDLHKYMSNFIESIMIEMKKRIIEDIDNVDLPLRINPNDITFTNGIFRYTVYVLDTNAIFKGLQLILTRMAEDKVDCTIRFTDVARDLQLARILSIQTFLKTFQNSLTKVEIIETEETIEILEALIGNDFNLALSKFDLIINNETLVNSLIRKLYEQYYNVEDLVYFGKLVSDKYNGNIIIFEQVINVINYMKGFALCEMFKVLKKLDSLKSEQTLYPATIEFIESLKTNISNIMFETDELFLSNTILNKDLHSVYSMKLYRDFGYSIYDKKSETLLGTVEYLLGKTETIGNICYSQGTVYVSNYDKNYMNNYFKFAMNWQSFITIVAKHY